jgi:nucleoside-diphosphate-sugar epimerase
VLADLTGDAGWDAAAAGCEFVLHVASPLSAEDDDADAIIAAACEGTLHVLGAASRM